MRKKIICKCGESLFLFQYRLPRYGRILYQCRACGKELKPRADDISEATPVELYKEEFDNTPDVAE